LDAVKVFRESNTVDPVSWFRRVILNDPKPTVHPVTVEVTVKEGGVVVLFCMSGIPMKGV